MLPMWIAFIIVAIFQINAYSVFAAGNPTAKDPGKEEESEFKIKNFKEECVKDLSTENIAAGDFRNVSFGPTVGAQVLTYDMASKQTSFNTGAGAGFSMRFYSDVKFEEKKDANGTTTMPAISYGIKHIRKRCRAETFDAAWYQPDNQKVTPWLSLSPMVYASKIQGTDDISIQPALTAGFFGELINVGTGFNLSGPNKGHVFLILSLGYGFKF